MELSDRAGVGSMYIDESEMQKHEGENDIFDKSLKDQMEAVEAAGLNIAKQNSNEPTIPYFEITNQNELDGQVPKRQRRSYNP